MPATVSSPGYEAAPASGPGPVLRSPGPTTTEREAANALASLFRPAIRRVTLMLTTRCNLGCRYCYQRPARPLSMSPAVTNAALDRFFSSPDAGHSIGLYGGEPLLEPGLVRLVVERVAAGVPSERSARVRIYTNGRLLDPATAAGLARAGVFVSVSIDGLPAAQNDRDPGSFPAVDGFLLRQRRDHPSHFRDRVEARTTLTSRNVALLASSVHYLLARGVRSLVVSPLVTHDPGWGDAEARELDRQLAQLVTIVTSVRTDGDRPAFRPFAPLEAPAGGSPGAAPCGLGARDTLFVDVDGTLAPCAFFARSTLGAAPPLARAIAGVSPSPSVEDPDLHAALASRARGLALLPSLGPATGRRSHLGPCASCEALPECFVCPASIAFAPEQDPNLVPAIQCDWNRLVAKHRRAFLARAAARGEDGQRAGSSSSAPATRAVTPARIDGT